MNDHAVGRYVCFLQSPVVAAYSIKCVSREKCEAEQQQAGHSGVGWPAFVMQWKADDAVSVHGNKSQKTWK